MALEDFSRESTVAPGNKSTKQTPPTDLSDITLRKYQLNMIEGSLMGDGSIGHAGNQWKFQLRNNKRAYIEYFKRNLPDQLFTENSVQTPSTDNSYLLYSRGFSEFEKFRDIWYPDGKKQLPDNFNLTGLKLLHWYIEDGNFNKRDKLPRIKAAWVDKDGAEILRSQIADLVGGCNLHIVEHKNGVPHKFRFYIPKSSREEFFAAIGPCPVEEYQYKWL